MRDLVKDFADKLDVIDTKDLDKASKNYPLWVQTRVSEIIDEIH